MDDTKITKGKKTVRAMLITVTIIIIIPILIMSLLYINNLTFKAKANRQLSKLPGMIGHYFEYSPTETERNEKKAYLADYYLSMGPEMAADKLYIIKKDDEKLYSEIIRLMNSNSTTKTSEVIGLIRNLELRKDLLFSIYDEIQDEKKNKILDEINRLETQDLLTTIREIQQRIKTDYKYRQDLPEFISNMDEFRATEILHYIDEDIREEILSKVLDIDRIHYQNNLDSKKNRQMQLKDLAALYEVKPIQTALLEIGDTRVYSINELAIIFKNLSILKSGEILSKIDDDIFIRDLLTAIRNEEMLEGKQGSITEEMNKSIQFISEYNKKIDDLVVIYEKMNPTKVARIAEQLIKNNTTVTVLEIESEPIFQISDASIIIDVLFRMKNKPLINVLDSMNEDIVSKITQILAQPFSILDESIIPREFNNDESVVEHNRRIDDLVIVFENMKSDHAANIVDVMMNSNNTKSIVYDILSKMSGKKVSDVLNNMEPNRASELTEMLAKP